MRVRITIVALSALFGAIADARAQQAVFNVPSADVLDPGVLYLETDQYLRPWKTASDRAAFSLVRGVLGIGSQVEVGANVGPFDYRHRSNPFLDGTIKWRPYHVAIGPEETPSTASVIVGAHPGFALRDELEDRFRSYAYVAGAFRAASTGTRVGAGVYHATKNVFTDKDRFGIQLTAEQPIASFGGLTVAADWFSGDGGYATPGLGMTDGRFTLYTAYGFANTGRHDDLLTLELGVIAF